jgi:anti-anti-sigma factor
MSVVQHDRGDFVILEPDDGVLDWQNHDDLRSAFSNLKGRPLKAVIVDLVNVERIDSVALGALFSGKMQLPGTCRIHLCRANALIGKLLIASRLDLIFPIHNDLAQAVDAVEAMGEDS